MTKRSFRRDFDELPRVFEFAAEFYDSAGIPQADRLKIDLSIEEIFTNMVKYNGQSTRDIEVELDCRDGVARVVLVDHDVPEFDVTATVPPDVTAPLEKRKVGGLGLYLTKKLMTAVEYEHEDDTSRIVMTKILE